MAPGVLGGLVPWLLTGWHVNSYSLPVQIFGGVVTAAGVGVLLDCFRRFAFEGLGTPAPVAPTQTLVVSGSYRFVRNPIYLALGAIIAGQAIALGQPSLLAYLVVVEAFVAAFVYAYEEPTLLARYGAQYEEYRRTVPAWLPRFRRQR